MFEAHEVWYPVLQAATQPAGGLYVPYWVLVPVGTGIVALFRMQWSAREEAAKLRDARYADELREARAAQQKLYEMLFQAYRQNPPLQKDDGAA